MKFKFLFFLLHLFFLKIKYVDESTSITLYIALDSELKSILIDGEKALTLSSYSQNELSDIYLIKKFSISINNSLTIQSSLQNSSLAAFIIENDNNENYYLSSIDSSKWGCSSGNLTFLTLVRDYIWDNNKKIPPLASVIQCSNDDTFTFTLSQSRK